MEDPSAGVPVISVAASMTSSITLAANGLKAQIIINAANSGGSWSSGTVTVGSTALSPMPNYTNTSASIGGGAVGVAPFDLHDNDCTPVNGASLAFSETTTVVLRHYGPVTWNTASDPVYIDWRETGTSTWTPLPAADFTVSAGSNARTIVVTALTEFDFKEGFDYRIKPVRDASPPSGYTQLKCANVTGTPTVDDYEYILHGS